MDDTELERMLPRYPGTCNAEDGLNVMTDSGRNTCGRSGALAAR
jgi:hypothetical protein